MDISEFLLSVPQVGPEFLSSYCFVNGAPMRLEDIQNMGCNEFAYRSKLNMPMKLYKYFPNVSKTVNRKRVNFSIQALKNNTVFMQTPSEFDDVYDSDIHIEREDYVRLRLKEYCNRCLIETGPDSSVQEMFEALLHRAFDLYQRDGSLDGLFSKEPISEMEKLSNELFRNRLLFKAYDGPDWASALSNALLVEYNELCKQLKDTFRTACFTTTPYSQLMWALYANNHRGFCIEYTVLPNDPQYQQVYLNLFPVVYCKTRPDMTKRIVDYQDKYPTEENLWDIYLHGALRKSIDWAYQNEWRLILPMGKAEGTDYNMQFFPITKVFLGNRMQSRDRNRIIRICKQKGIAYTGVTRKPDLFEMEDCKILCEDCPKMDCKQYKGTQKGNGRSSR
ncbi:MAG: DUF2971 domain-containing protein [Clostridiales bacterium]|nr:DUF2971 domain-containing protein [Clostridiales bacterium]